MSEPELLATWLIYFDDLDHAIETFTDEAAARVRYEEAKLSWNCHLFANETAVAAREQAARLEEAKWWENHTLHRLMGDHTNCQMCKRFAALAQPVAEPRPRIVCLCGSTRFYEYFQRANYEETMAGRIVLSVGFYPHAQKEVHHSEDVGCTPEQKVKLDELHKRKIDVADEVFVLNVGGYIGESTRSEIEHAQKTGKPIRYLKPAEPPRETHALAAEDQLYRCCSCGWKCPNYGNGRHTQAECERQWREHVVSARNT